MTPQDKTTTKIKDNPQKKIATRHGNHKQDKTPKQDMTTTKQDKTTTKQDKTTTKTRQTRQDNHNHKTNKDSTRQDKTRQDKTRQRQGKDKAKTRQRQGKKGRQET